ncbi:MAG: hypothetical protein KDD51_07435 [Bdellovibrionales bacterium]|nr:hypothetical protein [Bdellovibrionales bacterium]
MFGLWGHLVFLLLLAGCGISQYPGQPGVLTDKHSKLDFETLAGDGLYVYEATYDNRRNGTGMGAIVTKYYPGALTYTSSTRTNADGTLYRAKGAYNGARVEMISLPQQNQILLPPESTVLLFAEYDLSVDEVDSQNLAEADLFTPSWQRLSEVAKRAAQMKLAWLKAAELGERAALQYRISKIRMGEVDYVPSSSLLLQSPFAQNGVQVQPKREQILEFVDFFEGNFPKGYKGKIQFQLDGGKMLGLTMGLHTRKTAQAAGVQVEESSTQEALEAVLKKFGME